MMKAERFTGVMFLCVIISLLCLAHVSLVLKLDDKMHKPFRKVNIDYEKLYPFDEVKASIPVERGESLFKYIKERFKRYTSIHLAGYSCIVEAAKKYEDIICWNITPLLTPNPVIKLHDGYLADYTRSFDVTRNVSSVKNFVDFCKGTGVEFMYINLPVKLCPSEDKDISGILDFSNQNADRFLSMLKESGVRYYDFRKALHNAGMNHHEAFYITDHHWKAETGLWAAGKILEILRDDYCWNVDPEIVAPENFRYVIYPEWFLGTLGRKMTLMRAKPEDFTLIYPKFETRIKFELPDKGINTEGNLSIIYNMDQIEPRDYYGKSLYEAYIYGGGALVSIENKLATNGKKVLFINDSFAACVIPFLALGIQNTYSLDLRAFTGSVHKFIEMEKPDIVIVIYYSFIPGNNRFYDFR